MREHNGGIMFYTDTNGQFPTSYSKALVMLGIVMESTQLDKIEFEIFKAIDPDIDSEKLDLAKTLKLLSASLYYFARLPSAKYREY